MMKKEATIQLRCKAFPGKVFGAYNNVHLGLQRGKAVAEATPGDAVSKVFDIPLFVKTGKDGRPDFSGDFVHGKVGDRFLYLVWFEIKDLGHVMFRRGKIKLAQLTWDVINMKDNQHQPIIAEVFLTDKKGGPVCATLKEENIQWKG